MRSSGVEGLIPGHWNPALRPNSESDIKASDQYKAASGSLSPAPKTITPPARSSSASNQQAVSGLGQPNSTTISSKCSEIASKPFAPEDFFSFVKNSKGQQVFHQIIDRGIDLPSNALDCNSIHNQLGSIAAPDKYENEGDHYRAVGGEVALAQTRIAMGKDETLPEASRQACINAGKVGMNRCVEWFAQKILNFPKQNLDNMFASMEASGQPMDEQFKSMNIPQKFQDYYKLSKFNEEIQQA